MEIGIDAEKDTLQSLIRSCLLELNKLKLDLTELEVERCNDNTPQRIRELEKDIVDKEKEVSVIKFKAEDEINLLKRQLEEKDSLIKNQEDRIYELDYVNNSLDEIKEYFADQLREYKKKELADVNERLNESYKSVAERDAQINVLSRTIDDYKIKVIKLENNVESKTQIMELEKQIELKNNELVLKDNEISQRDTQIDVLREQTIPKEEYLDLQNQFEAKINEMNSEITNLKEQTIPKEDYNNLQTQFETEMVNLDNQINTLKEQTIPKDEYISLQNRLENELASKNTQIEYLQQKTVPREEFLSLQSEFNSKENELRYLKQQTIPREEYLNLQNELNRKNDKIKRLEEINAFFNELQDEQEAYDTIERTPPFRLEKKQQRR
ncbi:glycosyl transferase [Methanobrevibacter sp.]|uniref:glycosyl transferase n=1 Tax=Methanobrevibacter sp. TaxID=66852 RepID=UPI0025FAFB71|nr:glycosyl transferase [Methanobrevibacter sp.]MBQ2831498.1 glycosyl transferase [Methanobrevibacter sp.]